MTWESLASLLSGRLLAASLELAVLAVLVGMGTRLLRPRSSRLVALLWLLVMVKPLVSLAVGPLVPALTVKLLPGGLQVEEERLRSLPPAPGSARETAISRATKRTWRSLEMPGPISRSTGLSLVGLWAAGIFSFILFGLWDRRRLGRILAGARPASPALRAQLDDLSARLGVRRPPLLRITDALESPALARTLAPVVLLPVWLAEGGSAEQVDWALRHELTHWRMRDPWAGAVRQALQTLFFFHPAAWWVGKRWEEAAERACDRALVTTREEAACYAERLYEMLVKAGAQRRPALASGLFATRTQIGRRIAALLHEPLAGSPALTGPRKLALVLCAAIVLSAGVGCLELAAGTGGETELKASVSLSDDDWSARLEAEGSVEFTADGTDVAALSPGSLVTLEQTAGGPKRRMEIRGAEGAVIERRYKVEGHLQEIDAEAQRWLAETLPRFVRVLRGH